MAKKRNKKKQRAKATRRAAPPKPQPSQSMAQRLQAASLWLIESLVELPRYTRILLTGFFTIAMTFATFPLLTWFFRLIAFTTRNPDIVLQYTFNQREGTGTVLFAFSAIVGSVFYLIGWRIYVGTVGETPQKRSRVIWYFIAGTVAVFITGAWLAAGVFSGTAPAT